MPAGQDASAGNQAFKRWRRLRMDPELIKHIGYPAFFLLIFSVATWRVISWVGVKIALPIARAHIELVAILGEQSKLQTKHLETISQQTKNLQKDHEAFQERLEAIVVVIAATPWGAGLK